MNVIITVPHGYCITKDPETRHCDIRASDFALSLERRMTELGIRVILHQNLETPRWIIDMNRRSSAKYEYRSRLEGIMKEASQDDILLDVHSAPFDTHDIPFDIYFLDILERTEDDLFIRCLNEYLVNEKFKSYIYYGSSKNDIIYRSIVYYKMRNVALVEINESIENGKMEKIAMAIASFIKNKQERCGIAFPT